MSTHAILVRPATVADATAIAHVHIESSTDAYAPLAKAWPVPDLEKRARWWAELLTNAGDDRADLVAVRDGVVVGFISGGPTRESKVDATLEIYVVHVLPNERGTGVGSALWRDACARLRGPTLRSMIVDTFAELRCCDFYEARGGVVAHRERELFHGGEPTGVIYRWPDGVPSDAP